jgi:hypothetical protein
MSIDYDSFTNDVEKLVSRVDAFVANLDCGDKKDKTDESKTAVKNDDKDDEAAKAKDEKIAALTASIASLEEKIASLEKLAAAKVANKEDEDKTTKNTESKDAPKPEDKTVKNESVLSIESLFAQEHLADAKSAISELIAAKQESKKQLIDTIVANCQGVYSAEELQTKTQIELQKLSTLLTKSNQAADSFSQESVTDTPVENEENIALEVPSTFPTN